MAVRVLAGRYELVRLVGQGGMGQVWEGRDRVIGRRVAVKLLPHADGEGVSLFLREARTAGALNHPGVITVYDLGEDRADGTYFLVMEYVEGKDLAAVLHEDGPPAVAVTIGWAAQVAAALGRAHAEGVVHRDLKPANLMLTGDGTVKILDFGIARFAETTNPASRVMGTLAYMPPERFADHGGDARSDLYSFGCVLYELLTGDVPFEATTPQAMMHAHLRTVPTAPGLRREGVPGALDALVLELLAKEPGERPASAEDVRRRLLAVDVAPVAAQPPAVVAETTPLPGAPTQPAPTEVVPPVGRRRFLAVTATAAAVVAGGGITAAVALRRGGGSHTPSPSAHTTPEPFRPWRFTAHRLISTTPVVSAGLVVVGADSEGLHALDASTGAPRWACAFDGFGTDGTPVVAGDTVYVACDDGQLHAVGLADGSKLWFFNTGSAFHSSPAFDGTTVYVGSDDHHVYAVDTRTGKSRWDFVAGDAVGGSLAVADGVVYAGSDDHKVYALDAATGGLRWTFPTDGPVSGSVHVADGVVYVGSGDGSVYALDAVSGSRRWVYPTAGQDAQTSTAWVGAPFDGTVYVGGADGDVHAVATADGTRRWVFDVHGAVVGEPCVADAVVFAGSQGGAVYAVDATAGTQRWSHAVAGASGADWPTTSVTVAQGAVYVGTLSGTLLALDATTGSGPA